MTTVPDHYRSKYTTLASPFGERRVFTNLLLNASESWIYFPQSHVAQVPVLRFPLWLGPTQEAFR